MWLQYKLLRTEKNGRCANRNVIRVERKVSSMAVTGKTSGTSAGMMHERRQKRTSIELESTCSKCVAKQAVLAGTDRESAPKFLVG
jgi:hypothetical protein